MPASYPERAREIADALTQSFSDDVPPQRLIEDAAKLCGVERHSVLLTYAFDHPMRDGKFSVRIEVVLSIGRGTKVHGDGETPGDAITALGIALARFMDGEP